MLINKQIVVVWGWVHFYVLYGQECQTLIPLATSSFDIKSVNQITQEMHVVVECANVYKVHKRGLDFMPSKKGVWEILS